jgi:hypothetical protein
MRDFKKEKLYAFVRRERECPLLTLHGYLNNKQKE